MNSVPGSLRRDRDIPNVNSNSRSEQEFAGSVDYNKEMFVPNFRPRSHAVDVHLKNFPGLEEAGWRHRDALASGPLEPSAPARKHVVPDVAFE